MAMTFNRGDTFDFSGPMTVLDPSDNPVDLTGWSIAAAVLPNGHKRSIPLTATWLDAGNTAFRAYLQDTSDWSEGQAKFSVQLTAPGGDTVSSAPATIYVGKDVNDV